MRSCERMKWAYNEYIFFLGMNAVNIKELLYTKYIFSLGMNVVNVRELVYSGYNERSEYKGIVV